MTNEQIEKGIEHLNLYDYSYDMHMQNVQTLLLGLLDAMRTPQLPGVSCIMDFGNGVIREYTFEGDILKKLQNGDIIHVDTRHPSFEEKFTVTTEQVKKGK